MHGKHVPTMGPQSLCEIKVLLKAGVTVEEDCGWMRLFSRGKIEHSKKHTVVAWKNHLPHRGGRLGRNRLACSCLGGERQGKQNRESNRMREFHRRSIYGRRLGILDG